MNRRSRTTSSSRRRVVHGAQHQRASPKNTSTLPSTQLLQARAVVGDRHDLGVDLQSVAPLFEPALRRRAGDDGKGRVLQHLRGRRAAPDRLVRPALRRAPRATPLRASARTTARLPPANTGIENETSCLRRSVALVGAHSRSMLPCCTSLRRSSGVTGTQSTARSGQRELRLDLLGDLPGTARPLAFGRPDSFAIGERARIGQIAEPDVAASPGCDRASPPPPAWRQAKQSATTAQRATQAAPDGRAESQFVQLA